MDKISTLSFIFVTITCLVTGCGGQKTYNINNQVTASSYSSPEKQKDPEITPKTKQEKFVNDVGKRYKTASCQELNKALIDSTLIIANTGDTVNKKSTGQKQYDAGYKIGAYLAMSKVIKTELDKRC